VTAAYVYLNSEAGELCYSAAGHPPMLLLRNGSASEILENGLMLAAFDFATYTSAAQPLHAGDRLLLYTDGIVEAAKLGRRLLWHGSAHGSVTEDCAACAIGGGR